MILRLTAALCCGMAAFLAFPDNVPRRRLGRLLSRPAPSATKPAGKRDARLRWAAGALAGFVCALLVGGPVGWAAGALVTVGCVRILARLEPRSVRLRRARILTELPMAIDLLAACLRGGGAWHESVEAVADAIGGPLGSELARVAARIRLGADPAEEWLTLTNEPILAPLGRAAARAATGGAPVAATLARLARDQRRTARTAASARALLPPRLRPPRNRSRHSRHSQERPAALKGLPQSPAVLRCGAQATPRRVLLARQPAPG
jgi:Flp pilus assembly protein TadB